MEWLLKDSLLREEDLNVLKFWQMPSTVISCSGSSPDIQTLRTNEDWGEWLDGRAAAAKSGLTLMLGGRKYFKIPGNETSYLPFSGPRIFCDRIVPTMQVHRSISRVINRCTTATFSAITTTYAHYGRPLLIYNCRTSSEWPEDMALTVTSSPGTRSTQAVVFGCNDDARDRFVKKLSVCDSRSYHPLTIPTMFAEIERDRQFGLVDPLFEELVGRAIRIAKPHRSKNPSAAPARSNVSGSFHTAESENEPDDLMEAWLSVSGLKRGLQSWRRQLEKMISHCEELSHGQLHPSNYNFDGSTDSTPVNTSISVDVPARPGDANEHFDEVGDMEDCGRRIYQRLVELKCEYDDKIGKCSTIIEGMILATNLEWNQIGQDDAETNLGISSHSLVIARSTQDDSKQMRSIAMLTMIFLPATFVASVFSMSFFDLGPDPGHGKVSPWIWLYIVATVGFTGMTMSAWYLWTKFGPGRKLRERTRANHDIELGSLARTITSV